MLGHQLWPCPKCDLHSSSARVRWSKERIPSDQWEPSLPVTEFLEQRHFVYLTIPSNKHTFLSVHILFRKENNFKYSLFEISYKCRELFEEEFQYSILFECMTLLGLLSEPIFAFLFLELLIQYCSARWQRSTHAWVNGNNIWGSHDPVMEI